MRNTSTRALGATVALLAAVALFAPAGAAAAGSGFKVTIAARWCPAYTDITANRARNNIMESLRDLGNTVVVVEQDGQGTELVQSSVAWTLGGFFENLTLTGSAGVAGTGNALANLITGNTGGNKRHQAGTGKAVRQEINDRFKAIVDNIERFIFVD